MRNFELRIAAQRAVLSAKWLQTRSRSRTHSSANPRANNTPNPRDIPRRRHRTPQTRQQQTTLQPPKSPQERTEQVARAPPSARSPSIPRMRAPLATPHDTPARTVTNTHSDSTGGVPPRIPTPAGPLRARNLDKRLCVESSAAARRLVPSSATPKALTQHAVTRDHQ